MVKRNLGRNSLFTPMIPPGSSEPPAGTLDPPGQSTGQVPPTEAPPGSYLESQNFFGAGVGLDGPVPEGGFVPVPVDADTLAPAGSVSELTAQLMEQARLRGRLPSEIERARMFGLEAVEGPYREAISKSNMPVDFTNWDERTRLLDETEKGILEQAAVNLDLSQVTRDEMKLRLQQIGLQEDEANNLLGRIGLQEEGLDIAGQRLDLAEADINESINYLNQTLLDVDLDEASLDRNLATIADQITLTDLQKDDIGFQRDDLSSLDEISSTLLAARESLLGEETGIGGERIDVERQRLALEEESTELQSDRAMKAALRDSYARGASFTTGIREDVADLNQASRLALDELALRNTGLDLADRELLATSGYQQAEIDAARRRAEVDLQSNMRVLDLDESELGFVADRLGRSAADVADAITRLDTDRLAIQLQISEQSNALESLGLDRDEIANQLESLGYDRADVGLTLKSYELQRGALGLESKRNAAEDTLKQLAIDRSLREVDSARLGFEQSQKEFDHAYTQWEELNKATEAYETGKLNLYTGEGGILEQQAGYGATQAMTEAIQQWAPVLSGLTRGEYDQLSGLASQIPGLDIAPTGAASEPEMMFVPGGPTIDFHPEIVIPDTMYPSPEIPGGGYDPGGGGDPGGGDPGGEDDGLPGGFLPDPFDPGGGGDPGGEDDGFVPDYPGDVPDPPAGDDGSWTPPGYEDLPGGFLPDPFDPGGGGDPPAGFDPEAFGDYDFGSEFGGLFNAAPQPTGFTMDPGARRATRELGDQLPQSDDFATALLNELGAPVRANNLETIGDWIAAEGTTAAFNPLATTKQGGNPGDANRDQYDQFNSVGVKNYPDFATGVDRTAATLRDSFALPVLEGLMANVPAEVMNTDHLVNKALSTWSGGGYTEFPSIATPGPRYGPPGR